MRKRTDYICFKDNKWYFYNELWTELIGPYLTEKIVHEELGLYIKQLG